MGARRFLASAFVALTFSTSLFLGLGPSRATAQGSDAEARALFSAGEIAYGEGRYEAALDYFQRAYEISGRALLLYNVGSAAEHLRRDREALAAFERYLSDTGEDAPNRTAVAARIEILRRSVATTTDTSTTATTTDTTTTTTSDSTTTDATTETSSTGETETETDGSSGGGPGVAPWIVVGVGAGVAVVGAVLVGVGYADAASVSGVADGGSWSSISGAYERAPILEGVGFALLGVGVAAVVGGVVWGAMGSGESGPTASAWVAPESAGVIVGGSF